mgnify:CR=1 FL=1
MAARCEAQLQNMQYLKKVLGPRNMIPGSTHVDRCLQNVSHDHHYTQS